MTSNYSLVKTRNICAICGSSRLIQFLSLGETPLADAFVEREDLEKPEAKFPLDVAVCEECNLVALLHAVDPKLLFGDSYAFYTSGSPQAVIHFREYAHTVMKRFPELAKKLTIDIASNDAVLLRPLKELGAKVLGVEPTKNVAIVAQAAGIDTIIDFFSNECAERILKDRGKAGLIIANNVLAHVDDVVGFVKSVKLLLEEDGVFIFEVQYFPNLLFKNQFDNVYHEHHSFFSLRPLVKLLEKVGLTIFDIQEVDTQGGSIRVFSGHVEKPRTIELIVNKMQQVEIEMGLNKIETYTGFASRVDRIKYDLINILEELKGQGKKIVGYGAPAKGNTLLNFCGISTQYVDYIIDKTFFKHGKFTPGMHIPVFPIEKIQEEGPPDYYLLLVWNYASSILRQEDEFLRNGGKFIIPIPIPHIL